MRSLMWGSWRRGFAHDHSGRDEAKTTASSAMGWYKTDMVDPDPVFELR